MLRASVIPAALGLLVLLSFPARAEESPGQGGDPAMFPFILPWDDASSGVTDVTSWLPSKPAGSRGPVHVHKGRLHVGDDATHGPRERIRFWGVNLSFAGNFPTREQAVAISARLAKFGVNCVRFHHMDRHAAPRGILTQDMRSIDPGQLEKLDFFVAELRKRGIYANFNLHVSRYYPDFPDEKAGGTRMHKGLDMFIPGMIEWQKTYARELLRHRNPHTGLVYAEDPAVAFVEINNENGVISRWWDGVLDDIAPQFADPLRSRWNAWVATRHGSVNAARDAWLGPATPLGNELLVNGRFADKRKGWTVQNPDAEAPFVTLQPSARGGVLRQAAKATDPRRTEVYQRGLKLEPGRAYTLRIKAASSTPQTITLGVKDARPPWRLHMSVPVELTTTPTVHEIGFLYEAEADAELRVNLSGFVADAGDVVVEAISLRPGGRPGSVPAMVGNGFDYPRKRDFKRLSPAVQRDWMKFVWDIESAYYVDMRTFLRKELGVRSLLVGSQLGAYSIFPVQEELDVIDIHAYWQHPETDKAGQWTVGNTSMVNEANGGYGSWSAMYRVSGRPYLITEYNHPSPNTYSAEGFPIMAAYAALQDFDGIFAYSYSHGTVPFDSGRMPGLYDMDQNPVKMATFPIAAALFRRGDVAVPAERRVTAISEAGILDFMRRGGTRISADQYGARRTDGLRFPQEVRLDPSGPKQATAPQPVVYEGPITSVGGELVWNAAPEGGIVTVNTPRTKAAIGFGRERTHELGALTVRPGKTMQDWSMIALVQVEGESVGGAGRALLVAAGNHENTDQVWKSSEKNSLKSWGRAPSLVEGIPAELSLKTNGLAVEVWALDERGQRRDQVSVKTNQGQATFSIGPAYKTLWYEVVAQPIKTMAAPDSPPQATASLTEAPTGLFSFVMPWDDRSPGVTDLSGWLPKPAGASGHAYVDEGHIFVGGEKTGTPRRRLRIFGVNLSFAANFPTHEDASKVAARLAKFGVNCVRFHHMDRDPAPKGIWTPDLRTIDAGQLDRLDFFIAELKARGIYANLNLHVSRVYPGFPVWEGMSPFHKGVDIFHPGMVTMQRDYARELLLHRNPYTGLTYAEDPAVVFVEINNENGLISRWWEKKLDDIPAVFSDELTRQWRAWREARQLPVDTATSAVRRRDYDALPEKAQREWMRFLWETEKAYWVDFQRFLKQDLGVRALIIGTQLYSYSTAPIQAEMDVVDIHAYWEHPETKNGRWTVGNTSMVNSPDARTLADLSLQRVEGKPLIVTEYNHSAPNTYGAEAFLMASAYGAMQDWDGIFAYSYAHLNNRPWGNGAINGMFDIDQHAVKMATLPLAAAMFYRSDVKPSDSAQSVAASEEQFLELCRRHGVNIGGDHFGAHRHDALRRRQYLRLEREGGKLQAPPSVGYSGPIVSDGRELVWDAAAPRGIVTINTPRTKAVIGFGDGRVFDLGDVSIRPGSTLQGWSTIALTHMDEGAIGLPGRTVLAACGYTQNTGMVWADSSKNHVTSWGGAPVLVEGIAAEIEIKTEGRPLAVWALDERGQRRDALPVRTAGDRAIFNISPRCKTLWYELVITSPAP